MHKYTWVEIANGAVVERAMFDLCAEFKEW